MVEGHKSNTPDPLSSVYMSNFVTILTLGSFLNSLFQDPRVCIYVGEETDYFVNVATWLIYMAVPIFHLAEDRAQRGTEGKDKK